MTYGENPVMITKFQAEMDINFVEQSFFTQSRKIYDLWMAAFYT